MRQLVYAVAAIGLAAMTAGCGYSDRTYAYAPPGATYQGDRYAPAGPGYYAPARSTYYSPAPAYPASSSEYYSRGDYNRNYNGIHAADERTN
jgi:hypothetical protein